MIVMRIKSLAWRTACAILGITFLVIVASDAYAIWSQGGLLGYTFGVLHAAFFLILSLLFLGLATVFWGQLAKDLTRDFLTEVLARRNLKRFAMEMTIIVGVALAWVLVETMMR